MLQKKCGSQVLTLSAAECGDDSSDEDSSQSVQGHGVTDSSSESSGPRVNGVNQLSNGTTDTDTEEDVMEKEEASKEETAVTAVNSFSQDGEPEFTCKKVCRIMLLGLMGWRLV